MDKEFDADEAKGHLEERERQLREKKEIERKQTLNETIQILKDEFANTDVEVYLVGSITQPYQFNPSSDIDIVLKNFIGNFFDEWSRLGKKFNRDIELIIFETCSFQDYIIKNGLKVT